MGLSAHEIAEILGTTFSKVKKKMGGDDFAEMVKCLQSQTNPYGMVHDVNGLAFTTIVVDELTARAFIAKWNCPKGYAYLRWLFACEQAVPKLIARLHEAEQKISFLCRPRRRVQSGRTVHIGYKVRERKNIFGETEYYREEVREALLALGQADRSLWQLRHMASVGEGLLRRSKELQEQLSLLGLPPYEERVKDMPHKVFTKLEGPPGREGAPLTKH